MGPHKSLVIDVTSSLEFPLSSTEASLIYSLA